MRTVSKKEERNKSCIVSKKDGGGGKPKKNWGFSNNKGIKETRREGSVGKKVEKQGLGSNSCTEGLCTSLSG